MNAGVKINGKKTEKLFLIDLDASNFAMKAVVKSLLCIIYTCTLNIINSFVQLFYCKKKSIKNETILITGSAGYLGRQLACTFAKEDVTLILWDINEDENKKTYNALRECGYQRVYSYTVDLSNENDVRENAKRVKREHGFVSMILLGAASVGSIGTLLLADIEKLNKQFNLLYKSHICIYQEFVPEMIQQNHGHIAIISSECVYMTHAFVGLYASFKAAQAKLLESLDAELNYFEGNRIKTTIVYLSGLKGGISNDIFKSYGCGFNYINRFGLTGEYASTKIVDSILKNQKIVFLPKLVYLVALLKFLLPTSCTDAIFSAKNYIVNDKLTYQKSIVDQIQS